MKKEENQGKNTTRSLKELIYQLYEVAHEESFAVKRNDSWPDWRTSRTGEDRNRYGICGFRTPKKHSGAFGEIGSSLVCRRPKDTEFVEKSTEYKKMVTAHKGVLWISSSNLFTNILLDRFTSPESFVLRDYQIVISKFKSNQNQEMQQGEWYKLTGDQAHRYAPKCNEEGTFQRRDGNLIICVEIKKSPFRRLPDYSFWILIVNKQN